MINRKIQFVAGASRVAIEVRIEPTSKPASSRTIDLLPISGDALELSITGETPDSSGQCVDSVRDLGEGNADVARLCDIWDAYHLNGLKAGTRAQLAYLATLTGAKAYEVATASLEAAGLDPDINTLPGTVYRYGSAWLFEPVPAGVVAELSGILDRLDGARIGEPVTFEDLGEASFSDSDDIIDSRDVIRRIEELKSALAAVGIEDYDSATLDLSALPQEIHGAVEDAVTELNALLELEGEAESYCSDWNHGATLIRDSYFEQYAEELATDCGMISRNARWPNNHIDWKAAANELKGDYTAISFYQSTFWVR